MGTLGSLLDRRHCSWNTLRGTVFRQNGYLKSIHLLSLLPPKQKQSKTTRWSIIIPSNDSKTSSSGKSTTLKSYPKCSPVRHVRPRKVRCHFSQGLPRFRQLAGRGLDTHRNHQGQTSTTSSASSTSSPCRSLWLPTRPDPSG